jgi:hypothetical protein
MGMMNPMMMGSMGSESSPPEPQKSPQRARLSELIHGPGEFS